METSFFLGLDLGQAHDFTALAIIEKVRAKDGSTTHFHLRRLERYPLRTPYPTIADRVVKVMGSEALSRYYTDEMLRPVRTRPELAIDQTGVGAPVGDLLKQRGLSFKRVVITGGDGQHRDGGTYRVPKRDLVTALEVALQNGHLKVAEGLDLWPALREEMKTFKRKINLQTAHTSFEHWRETDHDDLVLAVCLACWGAARPRGQGMAFSYISGERVG
jgi:hypothetical protein